jgi:hypothetical protein
MTRIKVREIDGRTYTAVLDIIEIDGKPYPPPSPEESPTSIDFRNLAELNIPARLALVEQQLSLLGSCIRIQQTEG